MRAFGDRSIETYTIPAAMETSPRVAIRALVRAGAAPGAWRCTDMIWPGRRPQRDRLSRAWSRPRCVVVSPVACIDRLGRRAHAWLHKGVPEAERAQLEELRAGIAAARGGRLGRVSMPDHVATAPRSCVAGAPAAAGRGAAAAGGERRAVQARDARTRAADQRSEGAKAAAADAGRSPDTGGFASTSPVFASPHARRRAHVRRAGQRAQHHRGVQSGETMMSVAILVLLLVALGVCVCVCVRALLRAHVHARPVTSVHHGACAQCCWCSSCGRHCRDSGARCRRPG